ncbi:hypothetical protein WME99_26015 [Sorangium sp. So ce136]
MSRFSRASRAKYAPGVELGDDVLEIGPGCGATTRVLLKRTAALLE